MLRTLLAKSVLYMCMYETVDKLYLAVISATVAIQAQAAPSQAS
jgi:hypothetical protein